YYRLLPEEQRYHVNDTGCGNTLNMSHPRAIQLVMDSLRYWVQEFHIDGFRFDLGVTLGREAHGFDPGCGFFDALLQDPVLARVKLISEPWDLGAGGYQVGQHPAGFAEWNANFRDDVRRFWRGDEGLRGALAGALQGSAALFDHHRRKPWASVNFVTAHDGFTMQDLVSYDQKHNEANGEENRDGSDSNDSRNWGEEGPTDDPAIRAQRDRIKRNFFTTLLCSHGTPMLLAGDEFGQTQEGNNNAYCQDNELSWLDWELAESEEGKALRDFVAHVIACRRRSPLLHGTYFQHSQVEVASGVLDLVWYDEEGNELNPEDWENPTARLLGCRRAARNASGNIDLVLMLINGDEAEHRFQLPWPPIDYRVMISTDPAIAHETAFSDVTDEEGLMILAPHTMLVLCAEATPEQLTAPMLNGTRSEARAAAPGEVPQ
ncbi:MAG: hypothetical protein RBS88_02450, partial [Spongiibacteraceae bacterium]|nr:hypothetical protein [Spongiibacteraceae bacterium]